MTMTAFARGEYKRLRSKDWPAKNALRAARIYDRFTDYENDGLVKLEIEPEFDPDVCLDGDWDKKTLESLRKRLNREGGWILVGYWRPNDDADWEYCDSIGGFIGDDWEDSGYDVDVRQACLAALDEHLLAFPRAELAVEYLDF